MAGRIAQYSIGKENLYFFYRFIVLRWELEWADCKFLSSQGDLRRFTKENDINIKAFESTEKLNEALLSMYPSEEKNRKGILWFVRRDTKPKDILRHLRNCFAHGKYRKRQKNRMPCVVIESIHRSRIKAKGFVPLDMLNGLVRSAESCKV